MLTAMSTNLMGFDQLTSVERIFTFGTLDEYTRSIHGAFFVGTLNVDLWLVSLEPGHIKLATL